MATKVVNVPVFDDPRVPVFKDPYLMAFEALDRPNESLQLPYNPESYEVGIDSNWTPEGVAGKEYDNQNWEGNEPRTFTYNHTISAEDLVDSNGNENPNAFAKVEGVLQKFDVWATNPTDATQQPTRVRITAGIAIQFIGVIKTLRYKRVVTNKDGFALVAEVSVTFGENGQF